MSLVILDAGIAKSVEPVVVEKLIGDLETMFREMFAHQTDRNMEIRRLCDALQQLADQHERRKTTKPQVNF